MRHAIEDLDFYGESANRSSEKDAYIFVWRAPNDHSSLSATYCTGPYKFEPG